MTARLALVVLIAGLFIGGAQPVAVGLIPAPWDKLTHCAVFALFAVLIGLAGNLDQTRRTAWLWLAFFGALAIGAADELHQASLPGRQAGWDDLAADALGAALGVTLLHHWLKNVRRR